MIFHGMIIIFRYAILCTLWFFFACGPNQAQHSQVQLMGRHDEPKRHATCFDLAASRCEEAFHLHSSPLRPLLVVAVIHHHL